MSDAHDAGKGDASRVSNIFKYTQNNDEINWPNRKKKEEKQRDRLNERLKGKKKTPCPESEFMVSDIYKEIRKFPLAIIIGTCKKCGDVLRVEARVNRGKPLDEPVAFGYMGDCLACGNVVGGMVHWPYLVVSEEGEV